MTVFLTTGLAFAKLKPTAAERACRISRARLCLDGLRDPFARYDNAFNERGKHVRRSRISTDFQKVRCFMLPRKMSISFIVLVCCLLAGSIFFVTNKEHSQIRKRAYEEDMKRMLSLSEMKDIEGLNSFADELKAKWNRIDRKSYVDSILAVCRKLSSGRFDDQRQYALSRKLAILSLTDPNELPLETELDLLGHVMTDITPGAPTDQEWAQQRKVDIQIRLHAWKRLTDAIDPTWDQNDLLVINVTPPRDSGAPSGVAPDSIKDPRLRAEYEAAIEENRRKSQRYSEQYSLRKWLKRFPKTAEEYIVRAYCKPPFDGHHDVIVDSEPAILP